MADPRPAFRRVHDLAAEVAELRAAVGVVTAERTRLQRRRTDATRRVDPRRPGPPAPLTDLDAAAAAAEDAARAGRERLRAAEDRLADALRELGEVSDPRTTVDRLDARTPLLLLPLRIETRFISGELWVRIYPDQWAVDTFEDRLSETEVVNATTFWASLFRAGGDEAMRRAAWRTLVAGAGSGRAGWIIETFPPLNPADEPVRSGPDEVILVVTGDLGLSKEEKEETAGYWEAAWRTGDLDGAAAQALRDKLGDARADAVLAVPPHAFAERPPGLDPQTATVTVAFCDLPTLASADVKTSGWTRAARANVLPDRILLIGFSAGKPVLEALGEPIPPSLVVGPDPAAGPSEQFRIVDGELVVPDELAWMVDFDAAVKVGLGLRVKLPEGLERGFDRLFAIGLRPGATPKEDQQALEELLVDHHRSRSGLSILAQGTPTNNTDGLPSGLDRLDDPDRSYPRHLGDGPAPVADSDWARRSDGQWLAEGLGVDPAVFAAVEGADGMDQAEAYAMNTALWPATWGYFLDSMLHPLLGDADVESTRWFFRHYVSGRGRLPALRIGRQPYGIVPATSWRTLRPGAGVRDRGGPELPVLGALHTLLTVLTDDLAALTARIPHAYAPGDPHQTLLDVVALHPASVEFHQRYAESLADLFNRFRLDNLGGEFLNVWEALGQIATGRQLLRRLGFSGTQTPDVLFRLFHTAQHALQGPVVDDRPLSEEAAVRAYCDDGRNYLRWLVDVGRSSLEDLRQENGFTGDQEPTALLYVLLRHALLLAWWDAALRIRLTAQLVDEAGMQAARREPPFVHVADRPTSESRWTGLYDPAAPLTGDPFTPLHLVIPGLLDQPETRFLRELLESLEVLAELPTARLERLLAEHLDCASHRVDAWRLGLVSRQLLDLRDVQPDRPQAVPRQGVHLGAYGWLHDVRPEPRKREPVELPDELVKAFGAGPELVRDSTNGGFVHAPSLNHAATAAVLRSGFLANATADHPDTLAVNLSSERMRLATSVLQGLRNGQSLAALLGYRFERGLHDRHSLAEVDALIHPLRQSFPTAGDRDARLVLDGLELARHVREPSRRHYPFGRPELPPATGPQRLAVDLEVERLLDVHDALADLVLAEGVHQAVLGNFDRVASSLDAVGRGGFPPEPAVLQTPDQGIALTHRVALHLRTGLDHRTSPVTGLSMTPRATAEPAVNEFLAAVLPAPTDVVARVRWTDPGGTEHDRLVSQQDLGLQPIDLLWLVRLESSAALGELDELVLLFVTTTEALRPDTPVSVALTEPVPGRMTFFEIAPLVGHLRSLVTTGRPLRASDAVRGGEATAGADAGVHADRDRPGAVAADLADRVVALGDLRDEVEAWRADLGTHRATLLAEIDTVVDQASAELAAAGRFGITGGGAARLRTTRGQVFLDLLATVAGTAARGRERLSRADAALARDDALPSGATDGERVAVLLQADRELRPAPTSPVPTAADAYRTAIETQRAAYADRLTRLESVAGASTGLADALDRVAAVLPMDAFDAEPLTLTTFEDRVVALAADVSAVLQAATDEADRRLDKASVELAAHDLAAPDAARVSRLAAAVSALLGPDALFIPEFDLGADQAAEWAAAIGWSRSGGLLAGFPTGSAPVDDWLHGVARVRPVVRAWEQAMMLTSAYGRPEPELTPAQLPHASEGWFALQGPPAVPLPGERLLYTAHYPAAFAPTAAQAGILLDEWVEVLPSPTATTGIAFHFDSPDSEPPQAMLLVVPPDPARGWEWPDVVSALHDTLDLAQLRALEPSAIAETAYAGFLPATVAEATVRGLGISANYAVNNHLFELLRTDDA